MDEDTKRALAMMLAGLGRPELMRVARDMAVAVPDESILHSEEFWRSIGMLKGSLRSASKRLPPLEAAAVVTAVNFLGYLYGAISQRQT